MFNLLHGIEAVGTIIGICAWCVLLWKTMDWITEKNSKLRFWLISALVMCVGFLIGSLT